jgi:hypothetical protein
LTFADKTGNLAEKTTTPFASPTPSQIQNQSPTPCQSPNRIGTITASGSTGSLATDAQPPHYIPAPLPKDSARNLSFDIFSTYKSDVLGSNLFTIGDLYAKRKLDEYSVTTDFQVRFEKNLSVSDSADQIDFRLAKITYLEPWLQFSVGRFDLFPVLTPMRFFGSYSDMGIHRVDGAMVVLPLTLNFGIENYESYNAPPLAMTFFYTPSLMEASYVQLDTQQSLLIGQLRARFKIMGVDTTWRFNYTWSGTDYFTDSTLNGGSSGSLAAEAALDSDITAYGEFAAQNINYFSNTDVLGLGARFHGIDTWGPLSLDDITLEAQLPLENDPSNIFSGGDNFNTALNANSQFTWFGSLQARIKAVSITFAITNNLDDFTFNRVTTANSAFPVNGPVGPGRELAYSQIPLQALTGSQPGFLIAISTDF